MFVERRVILLFSCVLLLAGCWPFESQQQREIRQIRNQLEAPNWQQRWKALERLGKLGRKGAPAIPDLIDILQQDSQWRMRWAAVKILGRMRRSSRINAVLLQATGDSDDMVQSAAIRALEKFQVRSQQFYEILANKLDSSQLLVKKASIFALGSLRKKALRSLPALMKELDHPEPEIQLLVLKTLKKIKPPIAKVMAPLQQKISSPDPKIREAAVDTLATIGSKHKQVEKILVVCLESSHQEVRKAALLSLLENPSQAHAAVTILQEIFQDPKESLFLKANIMHLFAKMGKDAKSAFPLFVKSLHHRNSHIKLYAALALGNFTKRGLKVLLQALKDEDNEVVASALLGLGEIEEQYSTHLPLFLKAAENKNFGIRYAACRVLSKMGALAQPAFPILAKLMQDPHEDIRYMAAKALGNIEHPQAMAQLKKMLQDPKWHVRCAAISAIAKTPIKAVALIADLEKIILEDKIIVKIAAVRALGRIGKPAKKAYQTLDKAREYKNRVLQEAIAIAMKRIEKR